MDVLSRCVPLHIISVPLGEPDDSSGQATPLRVQYDPAPVATLRSRRRTCAAILPQKVASVAPRACTSPTRRTKNDATPQPPTPPSVTIAADDADDNQVSGPWVITPDPEVARRGSRFLRGPYRWSAAPGVPNISP